MTTFRLRKFSEPDALKAIEPTRLKAFLGRFADYFVRRGLVLAAEDSLDYEKLAAVLMTPDEDVPEAMVDALYFVHEMSQDDAVEKLLGAVRAQNLELGLGDEPTAADVAIALWLTAPTLLQDLHAEASVMVPKRFEYHSGALGAPRDFPEYGPQQVSELCAQLDDRFMEHRRGRGSKLLIFPHGEKVHIVIRHGATMRREGSIKRGERDVAYYRPEVHDALMYDCALDVLGIKAGTKGEKELYCQVIGNGLFGDSKYFEYDFDFTLDPLRERGPEVLLCEDVPGMTSVVLVEVRRAIGGAVKERQINQATDLFKAYGPDWKRRLSFGALVSATFEVTLGKGRSRRKRRVTIVPPRDAKFDRDDEDAEVIERWLKRRKFMPTSEEDAVDARAASALGNSGGPPATSDRTEGVAASAN